MEDGRTVVRRVRRVVREAKLELERQGEALDEAASRLGLERSAPGASAPPGALPSGRVASPSYRWTLRG